MPYTILIHVANEDAVLAEVEELPNPSDQAVHCTNIRLALYLLIFDSISGFKFFELLCLLLALFADFICYCHSFFLFLQCFCHKLIYLWYLCRPTDKINGLVFK